ncbi:unnamed protein product [Leuciscus chuanchicus]
MDSVSGSSSSAALAGSSSAALAGSSSAALEDKQESKMKMCRAEYRSLSRFIEHLRPTRQCMNTLKIQFPQKGDSCNTDVGSHLSRRLSRPERWLFCRDPRSDTVLSLARLTMHTHANPAATMSCAISRAFPNS